METNGMESKQIESCIESNWLGFNLFYLLNCYITPPSYLVLRHPILWDIMHRNPFLFRDVNDLLNQFNKCEAIQFASRRNLFHRAVSPRYSSIKRTEFMFVNEVPFIFCLQFFLSKSSRNETIFQQNIILGSVHSIALVNFINSIFLLEMFANIRKVKF